MEWCGVVLQVRVHNLNLWLDREGNPKGDRADATLLDAPWSVHAPKLILWAGAEALKATSVHLVLNRLALLPFALLPTYFTQSTLLPPVHASCVMRHQMRQSSL
jgi:hypothetical protein